MTTACDLKGGADVLSWSLISKDYEPSDFPHFITKSEKKD